MDRFKFFVFVPRQVRCFACKAEGKSRLDRNYFYLLAGMILLALVITWLTGYLNLPGVNRPVLIGSFFGKKYTVVNVIVWWVVVFLMLFSSRAHRCRECGSEYLKPL